MFITFQIWKEITNVSHLTPYERNFSYTLCNFIEVISSDNEALINRQQAIIWTNDDL